MKTRLLKKLRKQAKRAMIAHATVVSNGEIAYYIDYSGKGDENHAQIAMLQFNAPLYIQYFSSLPILYKCLTVARRLYILEIIQDIRKQMLYNLEQSEEKIISKL